MNPLTDSSIGEAVNDANYFEYADGGSQEDEQGAQKFRPATPRLPARVPKFAAS